MSPEKAPRERGDYLAPWRKDAVYTSCLAPAKHMTAAAGSITTSVQESHLTVFIFKQKS